MFERTRYIAVNTFEKVKTVPATAKIIAEKLHQAPDYFAEGPFDLIDPPLTFQQLREREAWMMNEANIREDKESLSYSPSEGEHYDGWEFKWDGDTSEWLNAVLGKPHRSWKQLRTREKFRDKRTGFMSNKFRTKQAPEGETPYSWPERKFYNTPDQSSYTQPSLMGWAVKATYESLKTYGNPGDAKTFLEEIYGTAEPGNYTGLRGENAYFLNHRRTSDENPLLFKVHPNETGRDYDSSLGFRGVDRIPGNGDIAIAVKTGLRWARMQTFGWSMGKKGKDIAGERPDWIPEQVRKKYAVNDVMFNVLFVRNLRDTAWAARELAHLNPSTANEYTRQAIEYERHANAVETAILTRMWHEKAGGKDKQESFFYNINARRGDGQINVKSITGLFPLLLDGIDPKQVDVLLDRLDDREWFRTTYPIPSHPKTSEYYDPHYRRKEGPNWQGPVWVIANHQIVEEGLVRQANRFFDIKSPDYDPERGLRCMKIAERVVRKTEKMLSMNKDVWEFYNPITGQGRRVKHFLWSNLGLHFDKYKALKREIGIEEAWLN